MPRRATCPRRPCRRRIVGGRPARGGPAGGPAGGRAASRGGEACHPARPGPPAFGGLSAKAFQQAEIFRARLSKRARHLRRWPTKMGITCYRLYERDIPEVPLVVDRYEDCLHIAEFERPTDHTPAEHGDWLDLMKQTAAGVLEVPMENVFLKSGGGSAARPSTSGSAPNSGPSWPARAGCASSSTCPTISIRACSSISRITALDGPRPGRRKTVPQPVRLHGGVHRLCGGGRCGLDRLRRAVGHLSPVGPAQHGPQRPDGPRAPVPSRRRAGLPAVWRPPRGVRPGRGRSAHAPFPTARRAKIPGTSSAITPNCSIAWRN